jgi:hypothetical protein
VFIVTRAGLFPEGSDSLEERIGDPQLAAVERDREGGE